MTTKIIHPFHLIEEPTFLNLSVSFETYFTKIFVVLFLLKFKNC